MKYSVILFLLICSLYAEKITVTADNFEADETKNISVLKGHVHIQKGTDDITADTLVIDFDKQKKPFMYTLTGHVIFDISTRKQHYKGNSDKIIYDPKSKLYTASGNVHIIDKIAGRTLYGEKIIINRITGKSTITGKKSQPVKFTFTVEE